ncbi:hypothetical protein [Noviherbaspirillum sedimenti]|uniref:Uncharacterized protein n=1 Tax=Noviherbaspirillum sedimenti TaxID=2320865 RepID=A0A3A3G298_9BURK|nr:hypothetical protein [Noviherbaspirillum sedimenti]RJG00602.1 hypothetical protein D3878_02600 [Noviherbaspirillum sedimenti]
MLGCLQKGVDLIWEIMTHSVAGEDVIAFFDRMVGGLTKKTGVIRDNAGIQHGASMQERQAKYSWRRFLTLSGMELHDEVAALRRGFGTDYTITCR